MGIGFTALGLSLPVLEFEPPNPSSDSHVGCGSSIHEHLNPYNLSIQDTNKTCFGMLKSPVNC